jgi:hypothetical protein
MWQAGRLWGAGVTMELLKLCCVPHTRQPYMMALFCPLYLTIQGYLISNQITVPAKGRVQAGQHPAPAHYLLLYFLLQSSFPSGSDGFPRCLATTQGCKPWEKSSEFSCMLGKVRYDNRKPRNLEGNKKSLATLGGGKARLLQFFAFLSLLKRICTKV